MCAVMKGFTPAHSHVCPKALLTLTTLIEDTQARRRSAPHDGGGGACTARPPRRAAHSLPWGILCYTACQTWITLHSSMTYLMDEDCVSGSSLPPDHQRLPAHSVGCCHASKAATRVCSWTSLQAKAADLNHYLKAAAVGDGRAQLTDS